jgi:hypothetical protein
MLQSQEVLNVNEWVGRARPSVSRQRPSTGPEDIVSTRRLPESEHCFSSVLTPIRKDLTSRFKNR